MHSEEATKIANEINEKYENAFSELQKVKEQLADLGENDMGKAGPSNDYSQQLAQINGQHNKKIQGLYEEITKLKEAVSKKDYQVAELQKKIKEIPMSSPKKSEDCIELIKIKQCLDVKNDEDWEKKISEILAELEAGRIMKSNFEDMQKAIKEYQKVQEELTSQLIEQKEKVKEMEQTKEKVAQKKIPEPPNQENLSSINDQLIKSKEALQTQLANVTKTLKAKEHDVAILQQSLALAEENLVVVQKESEKLKERIKELEKQKVEEKSDEGKYLEAFVKLANGIVGVMGFSFIETHYPIEISMTPQEKINNTDKLMEYLQNVQGNIEEHNQVNISNISKLKEQIKILEEENDNLKNNIIMQHKKCIESLETEKTTLINRINVLEEEKTMVEKKKNEVESAFKNTQATEASELEKLRKQANEERMHHNDVVIQMKEMHKGELAAVNSEKQAKIKLLEEKNKQFEEKIKRKKQKKSKKLDELAVALKQQENTLMELAKLKAETKKLEMQNSERVSECDTLKEKCAKAEEHAKKSKEALQNNAVDKQKIEKAIESLKQELINKDKTLLKVQEENKKAKPSAILESKFAQTENLKAESQEQNSKIESLEKALKVSQQRLLQVYEENNGKIKDLQDKLAQAKAEKKSSEDEKKGLNAECHRLQDLLDEATNDMKKMTTTAKKISSMRSSNNDSIKITESYAKPPAASEEIKNNLNAEEFERKIIILEDENTRLTKCLTSEKEELIKAIDQIIKNDGKEPISQNGFAEIIQPKIEQIKKDLESKYVREIEGLQKEILGRNNATVKCRMVNAACNTLQESIEMLKESLNESEKLMEEKIIKASGTKIGHEKNKTLKTDQCSSKAQSPLNSNAKSIESAATKKNSRSPIRMSALEQQYKKEMDSLNNEDQCMGTQRTVSFGQPESPEKDVLGNQGINEIVEESRKQQENKMAEEIEQEWDQKVKNLEKTLNQYEIEIGKYKQEIESLKKKLKEQEQDLSSQYAEKLKKLENEKEKEIAERLNYKAQEIESNMKIECMKTINAKKDELTKQYNENRDTLLKDFDELKEKLNAEMENKTKGIEKEYNDLLKENEMMKQENERKYQDRVEEKEKLLDNIIKMRIKEVEDDYRLKVEKLEYNIKYEAQCQTERQRAELTNEQKEIEQKYRTRTEELERKIKTLVAEYKEKDQQMEKENRKKIEESEKNAEQMKKKIEKECAAKIESFRKKQKESDEKIIKLKAEIEEMQNKAEKEKSSNNDAIQKKMKEEQKTLKEKHKVEIKNLKETHKNELIKKNIEKEREIKKLLDSHAAEMEQLSKQPDLKDASQMSGIIIILITIRR